MIPLSLTLRNFLSYANRLQTIDFEPYELICLSGKNGHGKSAILDAITWAIWGQARKPSGISRQEEALLHLGACDMMVSIDLACKGQKYRIKRSFSKNSSKNQMVLDIAIISSDNSLLALTEKTIRETQEKIIHLVGMSYDVFVASAFIRQGNANEFSKKTAKERKDILMQLLGLHSYEKMREQALERQRIATAQEQALQDIITQLEQDILLKSDIHVRKDRITRELHAANTDVTKIQELLQDKHQTVQKLAIEATLFTQKAQLSDEIHQRRLKIIHDSLQMRRKKKSPIQTISSTQLLENLRVHEAALLQIYEAQKIAATETANYAQLQKQETQLTHELRSISMQYDQLTGLIAQYPNIEHHEAVAMQYQRYQEKAQRLILREAKLAKEIVQLVQQLSLLSPADSVITTASACPLCTQTLSVDSHKKLTTNLAGTIGRKRAQEHRIKKIIPNLRAKLSQMQVDFKHREKAWQALPMYTQLVSMKDQLANRLEETKKQMSIAQKNCFAQQAIINHYEMHQAKAKEIKQHLEEATQFQQQIHEHALAKQQLKHERYTLRTQYHSLKNYIHLHSHIPHELQIEKTQLNTLEQQRIQAQTIHATLQQQLHQIQAESAVLAEQIASLESKKSAKIAACNEKQDYTFIAQAYSKDGIPALLIEQALPDIEKEANAILSKITDNQTQIHFEALKDLKSGKIKETLDIHISDTIGTRPYELFSGGEAFRIDFALRIALSKVLAHQAGIQIQTLIIDEGFGSQDEDGINHMLQALYAIQDDFNKIIIVSHLQTLKDQLPVHIQVFKGSEGSMTHVSHLG